MKKLNVLVMGLLLPMLAAAQTVKSPNGNVSVTFSLTEKGQPTYEMSYKGKTVCKPSQRLAARHRPSMRPGSQYGARPLPSVTTTMRWR